MIAFGSKVAVLAVVSASAFASAPIDDKYANAIQQAKAAGDFARGPELQLCLDNMTKGKRKAFQDEISSRGMFSSSTYVLLEVGNSGWGGYLSSALWIDKGGVGQMITDMVTKEWGRRSEREFPAKDLDGLLREVVPSTRPIVGVINSVDDGSCFFVTIKREGRTDQFAVYAPAPRGKATEESERVIDQLVKFMDRRAGL